MKDFTGARIYLHNLGQSIRIAMLEAQLNSMPQMNSGKVDKLSRNDGSISSKIITSDLLNVLKFKSKYTKKFKEGSLNGTGLFRFIYCILSCFPTAFWLLKEMYVGLTLN